MDKFMDLPQHRKRNGTPRRRRILHGQERLQEEYFFHGHPATQRYGSSRPRPQQQAAAGHSHLVFPDVRQFPLASRDRPRGYSHAERRRARAFAAEAPTARALGREKFIERVWAMEEAVRRDHHRTAQEVGASCDWSRERFTMDEGDARRPLERSSCQARQRRTDLPSNGDRQTGAQALQDGLLPTSRRSMRRRRDTLLHPLPSRFSAMAT